MIRLIAAVVAIGAFATPAAAKPLPDLVLTSISGLPSEGVGGGHIALRDTVVNRGRGRAARTQTTYYLSFDRKKSKDDFALDGHRKIAALHNRNPSRGRVVLTLPGNLTGMFDLIACVDDPNRVKESREANNCKTAARSITVSLPRPGVI